MTDSQPIEATQGSQSVSHSPEMSLWEKATFIAVPLAWTFALLPTAVLILLMLTLLLFFWGRFASHPSAKDIFEEIGFLIVFGTGAYFSTTTLLRRLGRRPIGEELVVYRARRKKWSNVVFLLIFASSAIGGTITLLRGSQRSHPSNWLLIALLWIGVFLLTLKSFLRSKRLWVDVALAGTWLSTAAWWIVRILASGAHGLDYWIFPVLMVAFALALGLDAFRAARRKSASLDD